MANRAAHCRWLSPMIIVALIAGCATPDLEALRRPNTSVAQTEQDQNECWRLASKKHPKDVKDIMAGKIYTSCSTYKNNTNCTSSTYEPRYVDVNGQARYENALTCMQMKGYR